MTTVQVAMPPCLIPVFDGRADIRGAWGGRGSGKTRTFAKMAAVQGYINGNAGTSGIILCARQFMNSLEDSSLEEVKRAIEDEPWLLAYYEIGDKYIRSKDGLIQFTFAGLDRNIASIKSKGRLLLCWVDEAEPVTDEAWLTLIPTLREEGTDWNAELWVTWNPKRKSAPVEARFRLSTDQLVKIVACNWRDNPRFPAKLERDRLRDKEERPDQYDHIWEGAYVSTLVGAYFAKHITQARADGRIGRVGADPLMSLRAFVDIGGTGARADAFTMWVAQFIGKEIRILDYYEVVGQPLAAHLVWMRSRGYTSDKLTIWLPHDGNTQDKVFDVSYKSALTDAGYAVEVVPNQGKGAAMQRVECARRMFPQMWFNEDTTQAGLDAVGYYHEKRDETRNIGLGPEHDWSSHGCLDGDSLISTARGLVAIRDVVVGDMVETPAGFAHVSASGVTKIATEIIEMTMVDGSVLLMTPEHKVFTMRGVVTADKLGYNDAIFTMESAPCLPFQSIKSVGYRDALIESFRARDTGFGLNGASTQARSVAGSAFCTLRSIVRSTVSRISGPRLNASTAICATYPLITGSSSDQCATGCTTSKRLMGFASTTSRRATTNAILKSTAASPCTATFGKSTMATFLKGCTSTTLMATSQTTALRISSYFLPAITVHTTAAQIRGLVARKISGRLSGLELWLKRGTQALKDLLGTLRMAKRRGTNEQQPRSNAAFAAKITKPFTQRNQGFATRIAKIRTFTGDTARRPVYDLTVDHQHCYIANGVLVSNSDSFGLMAIVADAIGAASPAAKPIAYRKGRFMA